jgi:hypothetical protein
MSECYNEMAERLNYAACRAADIEGAARMLIEAWEGSRDLKFYVANLRDALDRSAEPPKTAAS